jgi:HEPN domain-containing protein
LLVANKGPYDAACFHEKQAIEKLLKSLLAFAGYTIPRTHNLEELQRLVLNWQEIPELAELELFEATDYAVFARYDLAFWPNRKTTRETLKLAERVREIALDVLPQKCHP